MWIFMICLLFDCRGSSIGVNSGLPQLNRTYLPSGDHPLQGPNLSSWKRNPYLTSKFTRESDALHPQWVPRRYFPVTASSLWSITPISGFAMKFFHTKPVRWFSIITTIGAWFSPI